MAPKKLKPNESPSTAAEQDDSSPAEKQKTSDAVSPSEVVPIKKPATQCAHFITGECEKVLRRIWSQYLHEGLHEDVPNDQLR